MTLLFICIHVYVFVESCTPENTKSQKTEQNKEKEINAKEVVRIVQTANRK